MSLEAHSQCRVPVPPLPGEDAGKLAARQVRSTEPGPEPCELGRPLHAAAALVLLGTDLKGAGSFSVLQTKIKYYFLPGHPHSRGRPCHLDCGNAPRTEGFHRLWLNGICVRGCVRVLSQWWGLMMGAEKKVDR